MATKRFRNFTFIIYEDSAPAGWKQRILDIHIPGYYIFHDKDVKKPHFHVLMTPEGGRSRESIKSILGYLELKIEVFEEVKSLRSYARYLCHLDNPEKHKYDLKEVVNFCGTNYEKYINEGYDMNKTKEIVSFCEQNEICRFCDLVNYCLNNNEEWFEYLMCGYKSRSIIEYLKSKQWNK